MLNNSDQELSISKRVLEALDILQEEFRKDPTLFFTEHDLVSRAYELIQEKVGHHKVPGADGNSHYLVHHEYPTPFRCDMRGHSFAVKGDDDRHLRAGNISAGSTTWSYSTRDFCGNAITGSQRDVHKLNK